MKFTVAVRALFVTAVSAAVLPAAALGEGLVSSPWIGDGRSVEDGAGWYAEDPAPEFKAEFVLPPGAQETKIRFAAAGFASVRLGEGYLMSADGLEPLWSVYDKTVYSTTFGPLEARSGASLLPYPATNTVFVRLGNGFYNLPPLRFWGHHCFREKLAHGRPCFKLAVDGLGKDLEWKWRETNVLRNSVYLGTEIDATRPEDTLWKPAAEVAGPEGALVEWPRSAPKTGVMEKLAGKTRWLREGEVQVVDFGENVSGVPAFTFAGEERGRRIEIVYGERLNADGTVNVLTQTAGQIKRPGRGGPGSPDVACQRDVYVCGGAGRETFSPPFTWHVFRYAEIRGARNPVVPGSAVCGVVSMFPRDATTAAETEFRTSDGDIAAIHEICRRTFRANLIGGVQSDCPGRERLGYGGDIVSTYEAYMLNFDMREIYLKILRDFADEAADDGYITETAPFVGIAVRGFGGRSGPVSWALAVPELMDGLLRHYGERRAFDFYPVCARYVRLVDAKCPDGIVPQCIGDHEALERAPDEVTATAHWHRFVSLTTMFARMLGKADDAREFDAIARKVRAAFAAKYVKADGTVADGGQSAQAIAVYLGLVPEALRPAAFGKLVKAVEEKGCAPHTGIFSTRYMLMALSENGRVDLARRIVLHKGFPGWLHMIERGATTLWETWKESDDVYSNCHPMFGSVDEWIIKYAGETAPVKASTGEVPRILAHRGSRGEYQDNAAGGFARCLKAGVTGFEVDIRLSRDGHLVVMHDANVGRTTGGEGVVEEMTLAEIKKLRLNNCSEPVPTAREVMEVLKGRKDVFIELEMKTSRLTQGERLDEYLDKLYNEAVSTLEKGTYAFTSFSEKHLRAMKARHPSAPTGLISGRAINDGLIAKALELGCSRIAPVLKGSTRELVDKARRAGLEVTLWPVPSMKEYRLARELGAVCCTSDYPMLLKQRLDGRRKKLVALDLDATLCQHRSPVPPENFAALRRLQGKYRCLMVGAGNAPRIYRQMCGYPIEISGNYGMQEAAVVDGEFKLVRAVTNHVDRGFFKAKTDYLRKKYGYTEFSGNSLEFHASGMVTFGLLGTSAEAEHKVTFDPNRKRRRAMYPEVCEIFKDYSVYIGGSTSFDFAGKSDNKFDATLDWARRHGYGLEDIVFVGDDLADGGGDSHVRIKGMDYIVINDYRTFPAAMSVLYE